MDPPGDPAVGPHVLVGRDEDIAALERALDSRAPARAVELLGDPGMGKTSLLGEFAARAANHEVFLVSRMRERYAHAGRARDAIVTGYAQSGRVVIAAATIMTGVFGGFVLDADPVVKSIGLSLAWGLTH
jgi:hypothetical protein